MIQDIGKGRYHNEYKKAVPKHSDYVLCYQNRELLVRQEGTDIYFLTYREVTEKYPDLSEQYTYLFSIDEDSYFLLPEFDVSVFPGYTWQNVEILRTASPKENVFAGITGFQLWGWYGSRKFCPRCGKPLVHDENERMMRCTNCGLMEYPKICPAVIVGVTDGDKILLTRYAGRAYKKYALIAGFAEIRETIEETVSREVMEEVGLRVKNIRYYKSQPWSFSDTLLMGFFADLDGAEEIHLDRMELAEAKWCTREEIPEDDGISLTREMMRVFKEGKVPC